jgi:hypothetical protein
MIGGYEFSMVLNGTAKDVITLEAAFSSGWSDFEATDEEYTE